MSATQAITVYELGRRIAGALQTPALTDVWVMAELSDVRQSGGHCYMELLDKDPATGSTRAKVPAAVWANIYSRMAPWFERMTGQRIATGLKVLVRGSINYHPAYGMKFVINNIDPSFTLGEVERRRREILNKLKAAGILELNRQLEWPAVPLRIAVISAPGAAGYGDFINQLYHNGRRLRFTTKLFPAVLQGDRTPQSVSDALVAVMSDDRDWDCVVIIRGGGATSDLLSFDNYDLAADIAQFPLPVIIGIGHERDVTVLDYVANMRVKTPTAAAEWLIARGGAALDGLRSRALEIGGCVADRLAGCRMQLAQLESVMGTAPSMAVERAAARLSRASASLAEAGTRTIAPEIGRLKALESTLAQATAAAVQRSAMRLDAAAGMIDVLSPQATLRRGYSITRVNGHAVTDASSLPAGAVIETLFSTGSAISTVTETSNSQSI